MQLTVKTIKGNHFEIRVQPNDTVMAVKQKIEEILGKDCYPWGQQMLIFTGKILKDESTLDENKVSENDSLVVMSNLKSKMSGSSGASSAQPSSSPATSQAPPVDAPWQAPQPPAAATTISQPEGPPAQAPSNTYAASNLLSGSNLDTMINQLMEMGGGSWDRGKVQQALRAAYNNPERAVEYLYSGIPITAEVAVPVGGQGSNTTDRAPTGEASLSGIPNTAPLNLFPQGGLNAGGGAGGGPLAFLRNNQQFQALREMIHTNPQILQPMLQELGKKNPQILSLIQENHAEFLQLLHEPLEDGEGDLEQPEQDEMPHAISVTPEEQEAIGRLESMGFERALVIEAFFACDRNEELAANYLLEHAGEED